MDLLISMYWSNHFCKRVIQAKEKRRGRYCLCSKKL